MHWPQVTLIVLLSIGVFYAIIKHGEPRPINAWLEIADAILLIFLLSKTGFFGH